MSDISLAVSNERVASRSSDLIDVREVLRCGTPKLGRRIVLALVPLLVAMCHYAFAQDPVPVQTALIAEIREVVTDSDGRTSHRLVPAAVIEQGDVVFYTVEIRNPTTVPARDVVVAQRIPANTTYVPGSASGPSAEITFSVDGGKTFSREKQLTVITPQGTSRRAVAQDYTHIRWQLRNVLAPGSVALARFQAVFQ